LGHRQFPAELDRFKGELQPDCSRADELALLDFTDRTTWYQIWPRLSMVSCWADGSSAKFRKELGELFPQVKIEEKGLMATEAVVTIPWWRGDRKPVAYRSHFYEFQEIDTGVIKPLWEIEPQTKYTVLVTTGGGLYRYKLHDIVEVTGYLGRIPTLRFLGRENAVVDLVGEKMAEQTIQAFLDSRPSDSFKFAMAAPTREQGKLAYTLFVEPVPEKKHGFETLADDFDRELRRNYHYHHAREQGQLKLPRIFTVTAGTGLKAYMAHEQASGKKAGDIKIRALDGGLGWSRVFEGGFISKAEL
jgi:hypothetical protein